MKNLKSLSCTLILTLLALSGFACTYHKNLLLHIPVKEAANFLVLASRHAEKDLGWTVDAYGYQSCMQGKKSVGECQKFYAAMLTYAKTQPFFKELTLADLNGPEIWQLLSEEYQERAFESF